MMKVLSFKLAGQLFGIEVSHVREINRNVEYTPIPLAPDKIVGLFNMRGQIVTLINLAKTLGYNNCMDNGRSICIILKSSSNSPNQLGFLIEASGDVIDVQEDMCELPPANIGGDATRYIKTVVRLASELMMVIDPESLFE
jgi:purine-binding chemotaxis protein CheW